MHLRDYLIESRKKNPRFRDSEFAERIGLSKNWLSVLKRKKGKCSYQMAMIIEQVTDGKVTIAEMATDIKDMKRRGRQTNKREDKTL